MKTSTNFLGKGSKANCYHFQSTFLTTFLLLAMFFALTRAQVTVNYRNICQDASVAVTMSAGS